jgi:hypothetical protein
MIPWAHLVFWLFVAHALCDMPLQPSRLSQMKYRRAPAGARGRWLMGLSAHSLIHAGGVAMVTGSVALGMAEFVAHWLIDAGKGEGWYGLAVDQAAHAACKLAWATVAWALVLKACQ